MSAWGRRSCGSSAISAARASDGELSVPAPCLRPARAEHEVDRVPDGFDARRLLLGDGDPVAVLELHHQLVEVERVGIEVLLEAGPSSICGGVHLQLLGEVVADQAEDLVAGHAGFLSRAPPSASAPRWRRPRAAALRCAPPHRPQRSGPPARTRWRSPWARAAVADDGDAAQAEQDRAAGRVGVQLPPQAAEGRPKQQPPAAASGLERAASRIASVTAFAVPSISFSATLPVNPSVTTTSAAPAGRSRPSTLPTKSMPSASASIALASTTSSRPLPASSPTESRPTRGRSTSEDRLAERGAEEGELDQVLGPHLDVCAHVEEEHRLAGNRQLHRQGRAAARPAAAAARTSPRPSSPRWSRRWPRRRRGPRRRRARRERPRPPSWPARRERGPPGFRSTPRWGRPRRSRRRRGRARRGARTPAGDAVRRRQPRPLRESGEALLRSKAIKGDGHAAPGGHQPLCQRPPETRRSCAGSPRGPRRYRRSGIRGAAGAGYGSAGTGSPGACPPCGWHGACRAWRWKFSSSGRPSVAEW